jgi:tetratricopeptide (TPR) repeat protein
MKKSAIVLFFAAFMSITALAQSVQEGVNDIYAERYQSAQAIFQKMLAANPNNIEATYWLGQVYLAQNKVDSANAVYSKALASNGNAPLVLVGMGEVELMQGKGQSARQRFDAAITASHGKKGNDPNVLNAVGRANVDAYTNATKAGDLDYAIAKLNEAAQLAPNNPDIYVNLGNAYRKKGDGGNAVSNYRKATQVNPSYAVGFYRAAKLYQTQTTWRGGGNWEVVIDNLKSAIAADPKFAPAYLEMYNYDLLVKQDFNAADADASKYIAASDPSVENDFLKLQTEFVQKKYPEAINTGKNIIAQTNNNAKPRVYRALANSYLAIKDTTSACDAINTFFTKAKEEDIVGNDYIVHAQSCGRNNPDVMRNDVMHAVQMDSVLSRQISLLNDAIEDAKKAEQRALEGELRLMSYSLRGERANPAELVSIGIPFYYGGEFQKADSLFQAYSKAFPDSIYGYMWDARAMAQLDTTMSQGLAVPANEQLLKVAANDKVRFKNYGVQAAGYLATYYNNIKADKATALTYIEKGLEFDPTNASLLQVKKVLESRPQQPSKNSSQPTESKSKTKTKTTTARSKGK